MGVNTNLLKGKIVEKSTTQEYVADKIGIDRSTFYRKMKADGLTFTIGEVHKLVEALSLNREEAIEIFFNF